MKKTFVAALAALALVSCSKEETVKKFFRNFSRCLIFALSRDLPLEGQITSHLFLDNRIHIQQVHS